jgi:AAA family ATP:ADP antiporter
MTHAPSSDASRPGLLGALFSVQRHEWLLVILATLYHFFMLSGYYIIRPVRDAMGLTGGVRDLKKLFLITLLVVLLINPVLAWVMGRVPRRVFQPLAYLAVIASLLLFQFAFVGIDKGALPARYDLYLARGFYVWVSVFNLFIVSLFWAMLADITTPAQSKRLFGIIAVGGSLGAVAGSWITQRYANMLAESQLLLMSCGLLAVSVLCMLVINRWFKPVRREASCAPKGDADAPRNTESSGADKQPDARLAGWSWDGIVHTFRSPYLLMVSGYLALYAMSSTIVYFAQSEIVSEHIATRELRTTFFASIDFWTNVITVYIQIFLTGRFIRRLGTSITLALLPLVTIAGLIWLGIVPTLVVLGCFQILRRTSNYALARPARETLFTVLPRDEKFKAKSFVDTFMYRGGDLAGVGADKLLAAKWFGGLAGSRFIVKLLGTAAGPVTVLALLIGSVWLTLAAALGIAQKRRERSAQ